jgi:hypothetical protein
MRRSVVVQHQVDDVELGADENDLERRVPQRFRRIGPEEVQISSDVYGEVEKLRFEGYAGRALQCAWLDMCC